MAVGSAYASVITQFVTAFIQVAIAQRIFRFAINWKYIFTLLFFAIGVILLNLAASASGFDWRIAIVVTGVASVIWAFVLKLMNIGRFIRLIRNE
jgi:drug/metabolite transporter (DMT)-like permease